MNGKGDRPRPCRTGREERDLREKLYHGLVTFVEFEDKYRELLKAGKITRDGKLIKGDG